LSTYSFQPTPIPGREGPAPAPATGQPVQGAPPAQEAPPASPFGGGSLTTLLIMLLPILLIFMTMRGQTKKQKQLESNLKTGDTVISQSGLIGKIIELNERKVKLEIAPGVNVWMLKSAIQGVDSGDPKPSDAKGAKQEKKA
jgi:preprotein translocase subunit YajC